MSFFLYNAKWAQVHKDLFLVYFSEFFIPFPATPPGQILICQS